LKVGAVDIVPVVHRQTRIEAALGENDNSAPVMDGAVVIQVHENFAEEAGIEVAFLVAVAVEFDEVEELFGAIVGWHENAIDAEAGLLHFLGNKTIGSGIGAGGADQLEKQGWIGLKDFVEKAVGFHLLGEGSWQIQVYLTMARHCRVRMLPDSVGSVLVDSSDRRLSGCCPSLQGQSR